MVRLQQINKLQELHQDTIYRSLVRYASAFYVAKRNKPY